MKYIFEKKNKEVAYIKNDIIKINKHSLIKLKAFSKFSQNRKSRICCHSNKKDKLHEMIIYHKKHYYVRPHKHPKRTESIHLIEGLADIIIFNNCGNIKEIIRLGTVNSNYNFYYRLNCDYYHTLIIRSKYIIFHETSLGPFSKKNTLFPEWSTKKLTKKYKTILFKQIKEYEKI